ncbi:hypothetical protein BDR03DRAFT_735615 [Suillus americanus]|nr:hypothetical protein BDR03DRAFT_735615 [Suillus americanus]
MILVSDIYPVWWPFIKSSPRVNYFVAASSAVVVYDWALTFGQEFELILRRRWSFMTVLYICVRYIGILSCVINFLAILPFSITDVVRTITGYIQIWSPVIVNAMLGVIMIARIYAMYQGSKKLLVFLVVALLACTITSGVMVIIENLGFSAQENDLLGYYFCLDGRYMSMTNMTYQSAICIAAWEILALFLTVRIVIKHFCELRQSPAGTTIEDCFTMLTQSHAFYFLAFAIMACFRLRSPSRNIINLSSMPNAIYSGVYSIAQMLQMFVFGPRLILSIREYHAKVVADGGTGITSINITFQADGDALTGVDASTGRDM